MPLPSGFGTTLSNQIDIRLVLLPLVVMPATKLVLPFDIDCHCFVGSGLVSFSVEHFSAMTSDTTKLRQVLITRGKVVARREQVIGSIRVHKPLSCGVTFPIKLQVSWVIISLGSSESKEQYAGVRLHLKSIDDDASGQDCYLDAEEVQEFIDGIDIVSSSRDAIIQSFSETRDIYYSSKEDARVGIYKGCEEYDLKPYISLQTNRELILFTVEDDQSADETSALVPVKGDEFTPLKKLASSALQDLTNTLTS